MQSLLRVQRAARKLAIISPPIPPSATLPTCAGVKVMCAVPVPLAVDAIIAMVVIRPEQRNATADTAATCPSRFSHPVRKHANGPTRGPESLNCQKYICVGGCRRAGPVKGMHVWQ